MRTHRFRMSQHRLIGEKPEEVSSRKDAIVLIGRLHIRNWIEIGFLALRFARLSIAANERCSLPHELTPLFWNEALNEIENFVFKQRNLSFQ